jgi:hypothetical protein
LAAAGTQQRITHAPTGPNGKDPAFAATANGINRNVDTVVSREIWITPSLYGTDGLRCTVPATKENPECLLVLHQTNFNGIRGIGPNVGFDYPEIIQDQSFSPGRVVSESVHDRRFRNIRNNRWGREKKGKEHAMRL